MPVVKPVLQSVDAVWPLCGDMIYTFYNDPTSGDLVQSVIAAPVDNSFPL